MKWIRWVLLKIQSGHNSLHRRTDGRTDGQTDKVIPVYPPINFVEAGGIIKVSYCSPDTKPPPPTPTPTRYLRSSNPSRAAAVSCQPPWGLTSCWHRLVSSVSRACAVDVAMSASSGTSVRSPCSRSVYCGRSGLNSLLLSPALQLLASEACCTANGMRRDKNTCAEARIG